MFKLFIFIFLIQFSSGPVFAQTGLSLEASSEVVETLNQILSDTQVNPLYNKSYVYNGCFVRAHFLAHLIQQKGLQPQKIFLKPRDEGALIYFPHSDSTKRPAKWRYHVVVAVTENTQVYVLDTAVSFKTLTLETWLTKLKAIEQNQDLQLSWQILPVTEYTPESEYNEEFKSLGDPFSREALEQIEYDMQDLFRFEELDGKFHP